MKTRNRYTFAAEQCRREGMQSIGGIFLYTADQELAHARRFYELLKPETGTTIFIDGSYPVDEPGSVQDLLQAAAHNENEEAVDVYPAFARIAKEEGFYEAASTFMQIAEIEAAALEVDEDLRLEQERQRLLNHKMIADTLTNAYTMLDAEEFSSLSNVRSAMNDLESIEEYDPTYKELSSQLSETFYALEDITKRLEDVVDGLEFDGNRLMQVESRLDLIHSITRKYGGQVKDVLEYLAQITKEYSLLTGSDLSSEDLEKELKRLEKSLVTLAQDLSDQRHALAQALENEIQQELADLYMDKARFQVSFSKAKFNREGNEAVEFYISTNPGEDFKPLVKVASGGELSRLMLAIKSAFSRKEGKTSIVFDEVDTGVSGRVAQAIAAKIHKIGQNGQVLAISHLPQVIAAADYQFYIEKISDEHSTVSTVRLLNREERIEEIAKMLAGEDLTEAARQQAEQLLKR